MMLVETPPTITQLILAQAGTILTIIGALYGFHTRNTKRIQQEATDKNDIKNKLDTLYNWITENGPDMIEMRTKVKIMYDIWFAGHLDKNKEEKSNQ